MQTPITAETLESILYPCSGEVHWKVRALAYTPFNHYSFLSNEREAYEVARQIRNDEQRRKVIKLLEAITQQSQKQFLSSAMFHERLVFYICLALSKYALALWIPAFIMTLIIIVTPQNWHMIPKGLGGLEHIHLIKQVYLTFAVATVFHFVICKTTITTLLIANTGAKGWFFGAKLTYLRVVNCYVIYTTTLEFFLPTLEFYC